MRAQQYILPLVLIGAISVPAIAQRDRKGGNSFAPHMQRDQKAERRDNNNNQRPNNPPAQQQQPRQGGSNSAEPRFHGPGPHNGQWLRRFGNLPEQDQQKRLENDPNFQKLPKDRQQKLMQRLDNFNRMPPEQKERVLNRMDLLEHMTPEQRDRTRQMFQQFRQFDPESRQRVNGAVRRLRGMPPEARQNFYNSDAFRSNYTEQEQNVIKGLGELGPVEGPAENPDR